MVTASEALILSLQDACDAFEFCYKGVKGSVHFAIVCQEGCEEEAVGLVVGVVAVVNGRLDGLELLSRRANKAPENGHVVCREIGDCSLRLGLDGGGVVKGRCAYPGLVVGGVLEPPDRGEGGLDVGEQGLLTDSSE